MAHTKTLVLSATTAVIAISAIVFFTEIGPVRTARLRLLELSNVLAQDYQLSLPTNAVLIHYGQRHMRIFNRYYQIGLPEKDWQSIRHDIVEKTGGILHVPELPQPAGINLPWWTVAPGATVYDERRTRSNPLGYVVLHLVSEEPSFYILIERAD